MEIVGVNHGDPVVLQVKMGDDIQSGKATPDHYDMRELRRMAGSTVGFHIRKFLENDECL